MQHDQLRVLTRPDDTRTLLDLPRMRDAGETREGPAGPRSAGEPDPGPAAQGWHVAWVSALALLLGAVAGPLSWYAHDHLSGAARLLGDSAAGWLALAFLAGRPARNAVAGAVAGFLALGTAVLTYYAVQQSYGTWVETDRAVAYWQLLAALTGPVFGALGAAARGPRPLWQGFAVATMSAACCAEALAGYGAAASVAMRELYVGEGLIGLFLLVALCRQWRSLVAALCWLPVLAVIGMQLVADLLHKQHSMTPLLARYLDFLG